MAADPLISGTRATALVAQLRDAKLTIAVAESLTGSLLGATLTGVPGASQVFQGGAIVYATEMKHELAGVSDATLTAYGPVSFQTAVELADGIRLRCHSDIGIALTGVAGPDPQDGHSVGEVWCGVSAPTHAELLRGPTAAVSPGVAQQPGDITSSSIDGTFAVRWQFSPSASRFEIRRQATQEAIALLSQLPWNKTLA